MGKRKGYILMKKRYCIYFLSVFLILLLNSCNRLERQQKDVLDDGQIGVIETSGDAKKSGIIFYDAELNKKF